MSFLGGGQYNSIQTYALSSFLGGGEANSILMNAEDSALVGGYENSIQVNAYCSFLGGGYTNSIQTWALYSVLVGGQDNSIQPDAFDSVLVGGSYNSVSGSGGFIGGGGYNGVSYGGNTNAGNAAVIVGGMNNLIASGGNYSVIGGGFTNTIQTNANDSTIGGGVDNVISTGAYDSTIGGGVNNVVGGAGGTVPGGNGNGALGLNSFAAGTFAQATNNGAFVLADLNYVNFYSTSTNQLSARFTGGVRFVTAGAGMTLDGQPILAGSSSTNYIQNQSAGAQAASFDISGTATIGGNAQISGLLRSGSETGTAEAPSPAGLVVRRVNSTGTALTSNSVVAVSGALTLVRDGTYAGFQIKYPASPGLVTIACMGLTTNGTAANFYTFLPNPGTAGTVQIYSNSQNVAHFECTFGITFDSGYPLTQVTLSRYGTDYYWSGNVNSGSNQ